MPGDPPGSSPARGGWKQYPAPVMLDLATELSHLEQADRHIAQAKANIAKISERLAAA